VLTALVHSFAQPYFLFAALLAPLAWWWSARASGRVVFSSLRALPAAGRTWRTQLAWLPDALVGVAVLALAIALAGPRLGDKHGRIHSQGIAIMMAVDISGSMRAEDLADPKHPDAPTRLDAVKRVFEHFVLGGDGLDGRPDDAIGLVAFARFADTRSPLTLDHGNLIAAARQLRNAAEDEDGTAIGAGLELALQRLVDFKRARSKIVVLLTDGVSNVHDIDEDTAIDDARKAGIKVYTIGAGTKGDAPIHIDAGNGQTVLRTIRGDLDESLLHKIADRTGGQYFRATDAASLAKIYEQIDRLERSSFEEARFTEYRQYYSYFVSAALIASVLAFALRGTLLRRLP
jgi:Ca-activated chloride channel homolog